MQAQPKPRRKRKTGPQFIAGPKRYETLAALVDAGHIRKTGLSFDREGGLLAADGPIIHLLYFKQMGLFGPVFPPNFPGKSVSIWETSARAETTPPAVLEVEVLLSTLAGYNRFKSPEAKARARVKIERLRHYPAVFRVDLLQALAMIARRQKLDRVYLETDMRQDAPARFKLSPGFYLFISPSLPTSQDINLPLFIPDDVVYLG